MDDISDPTEAAAGAVLPFLALTLDTCYGVYPSFCLFFAKSAENAQNDQLLSFFRVFKRA